ncbi:hypothetical protein PVK06_046697 [Gossypium arboreum]|uniref:RNase H type-1 domain-containing protein n=1 Tax=Gossypium arboreum TaxID=29729 RepID=A0ABR0MBM2_GOSAR|nr:hypothetical protein PVK06_046697 [Gossypium arboreum]
MNLVVLTDQHLSTDNIVMTSWSWAKVSMKLGATLQQQNSLCWEKLLIGWVKLIKDDGVHGKSGNATAGVLVRGHKGDWVVDYGCNLGVSLVLEAELQAILDGVKIAWDKRVCQLLVKSDNKIAVDSILGTRKVGTRKVVLKICNGMKRG